MSSKLPRKEKNCREKATNSAVKSTKPKRNSKDFRIRTFPSQIPTSNLPPKTTIKASQRPICNKKMLWRSSATPPAKTSSRKKES
jgi:hypothetical protein